jgi:hypothetical protein
MKHLKKFRQTNEANSRQLKAHKIEKAEHKEKSPSRIRLELIKLQFANKLLDLLMIGEEYENGPKSR